MSVELDAEWGRWTYTDISLQFIILPHWFSVLTIRKTISFNFFSLCFFNLKANPSFLRSKYNQNRTARFYKMWIWILNGKGRNVNVMLCKASYDFYINGMAHHICINMLSKFYCNLFTECVGLMNFHPHSYVYVCIKCVNI